MKLPARCEHRCLRRVHVGVACLMVLLVLEHLSVNTNPTREQSPHGSKLELVCRSRSYAPIGPLALARQRPSAVRGFTGATAFSHTGAPVRPILERSAPGSDRRSSAAPGVLWSGLVWCKHTRPRRRPRLMC